MRIGVLDASFLPHTALPSPNQPIGRALISVWNKSEVTDLAKELAAHGAELLCSGGTAQHLRQAGLKVTELSSLTGFDELLGGRVKTLHPNIYASILARPGADEREIAESGLAPVDLVVVDLYPFATTLAEAAADGATVSDADLVEKIDIGGVCLLRAAAKNFVRTTAVHDSAGRQLLLQEIRQNKGAISTPARRRLAASALRATSAYDALIAAWLETGLETGEHSGEAPTDQPPEHLELRFSRRQSLRYGENPHQPAALYLSEAASDLDGMDYRGIYGAAQLQGKELSYNNMQDAQAAWDAVQLFADDAACVVVKHANPCAAALGASLVEAWQRALLADRTSPFGGIVAVNRQLDAEMAQALIDFGFLEVVLAPAFAPEALQLLAGKRNLRLLQVAPEAVGQRRWQWAGSGGALLVQQADTAAQSLGVDDLRTVTAAAPTSEQLEDLLFAWKIAAFVKSNAIVCARDKAVTAVGAGQMSRVFSMQIAALKAELEGMTLAGSVMASDAFFPFRDSIDRAAEQGITAVIQPGGSVRDEEVIAAADERGIAMVFTGMRHFRH